MKIKTELVTKDHQFSTFSLPWNIYAKKILLYDSIIDRIEKEVTYVYLTNYSPKYDTIKKIIEVLNKHRIDECPEIKDYRITSENGNIKIVYTIPYSSQICTIDFIY